MKLNQAVSRRLSELLDERKMTQYQLYMKSGVPKSTIGNIINCSYDSVKLRIIHEMYQGLGIGIDTFLLRHFSKKIIWNHKTSDELRRRSYHKLNTLSANGRGCLFSRKPNPELHISNPGLCPAAKRPASAAQRGL